MTRENDILQELRELNSALADYSRAMPHEIPPAYFEGLPANVIQAVAAEVVLPGKEMPYAVPDAYFDHLPLQVIRSVKNEAVRETITPSKSRRITMNLRWAAAAVLIISLSIGSYRILNPRTLSIEQQLDKIPDEAILAYVQDNIDEFETDIIANHIQADGGIQAPAENLKEETINDYLESAGWQ